MPTLAQAEGPFAAARRLCKLGPNSTAKRLVATALSVVIAATALLNPTTSIATELKSRKALLDDRVQMFDVPLLIAEAAGAPCGITSGKDGNIWFMLTKEGPRSPIFAIGKMTTGGEMTLFPVIDKQANCKIVDGPDDAIWWTLPDKLARFSYDGAYSEVVIPDATRKEPDGKTSDPMVPIAVGPNGRIWFAPRQLIGYDQKSGQITRLDVIGKLPPVVSTNSAQISSLYVKANGSVLFGTTNGFVGFAAPDGRVSASRLPTGLGIINSVTLGDDGAIWAADFLAPVIWKLNNGTLQTISLPTSVWKMLIGPDHAIWYAYVGGAIGRITQDGKTAVGYKIDNDLITVPDITSGPDGSIWFINLRSIGRIRPP